MYYCIKKSCLNSLRKTMNFLFATKIFDTRGKFYPFLHFLSVYIRQIKIVICM